jgi:peptidase E
MTKYILESGSIKKYPDKYKVFWDEALKGLGNKPVILWCFFALPKSDREGRFEEYSSFSENFMSGNIKPQHLHATEENFEEMVKKADLIQLQGGYTEAMKTNLSQFNLEEMFLDKVVAGHSAGSDVLCHSFATLDGRDIRDGFGIINAKFLPHYNSDYGYGDSRGPIDWENLKAKLEAYGDTSLPVYALEEGEFVVFEK